MGFVWKKCSNQAEVGLNSQTPVDLCLCGLTLLTFIINCLLISCNHCIDTKEKLNLGKPQLCDPPLAIHEMPKVIVAKELITAGDVLPFDSQSS